MGGRPARALAAASRSAGSLGRDAQATPGLVAGILSSTMIDIDGSHGEGGGQILRTSLGLSMVTGRPFRIRNIRANREKPGLQRQHLTAVTAAATICSADVIGAELRSRELTFTPGAVRPGPYTFDIGTAGSTSLVLQAVLPPLLVGVGPSSVTLIGGTVNPFAPPFDFLDKAFLPLVNRMGPRVRGSHERYGFAPAGRGRVGFEITPAPGGRLARLDLNERGAIVRRACIAHVAALPEPIAERELAAARRILADWPADAFHVARIPADQGPGNYVSVEVQAEHVTEVFTAIGQRGVRAEAVADDAATQARRYLAADVPVGDCLADQLLIPLAIAGAGSFTTGPLTRHARTST